MAPYTAELARRVEERLVRHGIAGHIEIDDTRVRLVTGHSRVIAIVIRELIEWESAIPERRAQLVERIVGDLVRLRSSAASNSSGSSFLQWLQLITVLALVSAGCFGAWRWLGKPARDAVLSPVEEHPSAAQARLTMAAPMAQADLTPAERCERVQARIATGGTLSPLDVDGWVIELALLSENTSLFTDSPSLDAFLSKPVAGAAQARQLTWAEDDDLRGLGDAGSFAVVTSEPLAGLVGASKSGIRITWSGKYVQRYFNEATRSKLQRLAAAIYEATQAKFGALYARCTATSIHQAGSWFRGSELSSAMLAMVASMGLHAPVVHLDGGDPAHAAREQQRQVWRLLAERTRALGKEALTFELAEDGASIASRPGKWTSLTFPFQDANRATRASLRLTKKVGMAPRF